MIDIHYEDVIRANPELKNYFEKEGILETYKFSDSMISEALSDYIKNYRGCFAILDYTQTFFKIILQQISTINKLENQIEQSKLNGKDTELLLAVKTILEYTK